MIEPPLVAVSFKVIKSKSCCYIDGKTGDEIQLAHFCLTCRQLT